MQELVIKIEFLICSTLFLNIMKSLTLDLYNEFLQHYCNRMSTDCYTETANAMQRVQRTLLSCRKSDDNTNAVKQMTFPLVSLQAKEINLPR